MVDAVFTISYGACALAYGVLIILINRIHKEIVWRRPAMACCIMTGLWALAVLVWADGLTSPLVGRVFEILRDAVWFHLLLSLIAGLDTGAEEMRRRLSARWLLPPVAVLLIAVVTAADLPAFADFTPLLWSLVQMFLVVIPVFGLVAVENLLRNSGPSGRWGLKYLCLGLGTIFAIDFVLHADALLLRHSNQDMLAARGFVVAFSALPMAMALKRMKSWTRPRDIDIDASRKGAFFTTALTLTGLYLLIMSGTGFYIRQIGGHWGAPLQTTFMIGGLALLVGLFISDKIKSQLHLMVQKHFFTYKCDYRQEWLRFVQVMSTRTPLKLRERLLRSVAEMMNSPAGALWVRQQRDNAFVPGATWNFRGVCPSIDQNTPMIEFLRATGRVVEIDVYRASPNAYPGASLPDWITNHNQGWIVVPLRYVEELLGFLVLDHARVSRALDWEDRDLLNTVAAHAASYLAQELAVEALSEAQRFEEFNRRFAFVVHDLKNIVGQMSLMLENARRFGDNPEFQKDMMETVENSVGRMKSLLAQLVEKRRQSPSPANRLNLGQVLTDVADRWRKNQPALRMETPQDDVWTETDRNTLTSALDLLIDNAFGAAGPQGWVALRLLRVDRHAVIEVTDNGPGMDPNFVQTDLFQPLRSTKSDGFGIGAYQTRHLIQEIGGRLDVITAPDKGTTMRILLPLKFEADCMPTMGTA
ncbi:Histidine kinase [Azospirillaceae bacterium]